MTVTLILATPALAAGKKRSQTAGQKSTKQAASAERAPAAAYFLIYDAQHPDAQPLVLSETRRPEEVSSAPILLSVGNGPLAEKPMMLELGKKSAGDGNAEAADDGDKKAKIDDDETM